MTIDELKRLMPPPDEPVYPGSKKEWNAFQKKVGLKFPDEYFTVANTYGSGRFLGGEFKVANPFDPDDKQFAELELTRLREIKTVAASEVPFPLYPEPGGLYPFGIDNNGNTFDWITDGESDEWPIACFDDTDYHEVVKYSLIEFLVRMATNRLEIKTDEFWGNEVSEGMLKFVPRQVRPKRRRKSKS